MNVALWLRDNLQWIFSGIGVPVVVGLLALIWRRRRPANAGPVDPDEIVFLAQPISPPKPSPIWTFAANIPGLRRIAQTRIFTEQEIARRIRVTIRSEGDGVAIYKNGEEGTAHVYLDIVNLNPFPISLHPLTGDLTVADAAIAHFDVVDHFEVDAQSCGDVSFSFLLSKAQLGTAVMLVKNRPDATAGIYANIYVESPVRRVKLTRRTSSGNRRFTNF